MASSDYETGSPLTGSHDAIMAEQEAKDKNKKEAQAKAKAQAKKDSKTDESVTYTKPNGYLSNGSSLPDNTKFYQTDNTGAFSGALDTSLTRQTGVQVPRTFSLVLATFHTQDGDVNANYTLGRTDIQYAVQQEYGVHFNDELLGYTTKNDNQADIPTMTLRLSGMRTWDEVLLVNDYVSLSVTVWGDAYAKPETTVLMTGLISEVHKLDEPQSDSNTYLVTCQSVAKFMSNVTLTTFTELAANGGYLLQDSSGTAEVNTGDESDTGEDTDDTGEGDSSDSDD